MAGSTIVNGPDNAGGCAVRSSGQPVADVFAALPDPWPAATLAELIERLRLVKAWAGDPSYEQITGRVNAAWRAAGRPAGELVGKTTVVSCFRSGRRRVNPDLVVAVGAGPRPGVGCVGQGGRAAGGVGGAGPGAGGRGGGAGAQVRVQDKLPPDLAGFTGRTTELDRLSQALHQGAVSGGAVVVSAIAGMAGVGKTQLAVHAAHVLARQQLFERVLFVNLRG